jgi:hypothetical protein
MGKSGTSVKNTWTLFLLHAITPVCHRTCHIRDADELVQLTTEKNQSQVKKATQLLLLRTLCAKNDPTPNY